MFEENPSVQTVNVPKQLDTEEAQKLLKRIQELIKRYALVEQLVHRQEENDQRAPLVEGLIKRQHENSLKSIIDTLHPADIAFILGSLPNEQRMIIWGLVSDDLNGDVLLEVDDSVRESLIAAMDRNELLNVTETLDADELADLAPDLPADIIAEVQKGLSQEERTQFVEAMTYPEGSVGAIMDFEMVRVRQDVSLDVVLRYLRRLGSLPNNTDKFFVVDREDRLQGSLSVSSLLVNDPETIVDKVMSKDILSFNPDDDDRDAANSFERYDLISAPVVNQQNRLVGRVTIAEVVDVIREDSEEQNLSRAGLQEEDIFSSISQGIKNRSPWLLLNLCTASVASFVASQFEDTVSKIVILAFLMSIVAGIGGNSGNQSMTLIIRALARGQVTSSNIINLLRRELSVTFSVGVFGSLIAAIFSWILSGSFLIAVVMMSALIINMLIGSCLGVIIPLIRNRFGKDPALGSAVLLTFATDSLGFLIFLGLANIFLL